MLFKSVFARYMLAFVVIILISFSILSMIVANQVMDYSTQIKDDELSRIANKSEDMISVAYKNSKHSNFTDFVNAEYMMLYGAFEFIDSGDETNVVLADINGKILWCTQLDPNKETYVDRNKKLSEQTIEKALSSGFGTEETTLDGVLKHPCYVKSLEINVDGEVQGVLFVTTISSNVYNFVMSTVKTIVMSCMWVMCGAIIASYFISEKIVHPIRQMSQAAREFAVGKLDARVPVQGNDEVSELAMAFNNMASSLERNEETRRSFLANVSHDMRTPMTTIGGFIDAILDGTIPEDQQEHYLKIVSSEIKRLSRLVSTLLDISKIQAGERKFTMEPFDICELSRQIIISLEQRITDKNLDVEFECDEDRMIAVADRDAIYQVLYNICDNGVKFSSEGGKYKLSIKYSDKKIIVSVYNEGTGIPKEDLPYVFDRFYKSDKSRGFDKTGVGLGMYISRTIMEAHGENITVRSKQDEFCEFSITLKKNMT
ncbi:MAG: HAMP domain-containing histidine kinase [Clostridia bacterium]|nr:HAMP domain-containing histidine kinase [Clostridia bacterium]